MMKLDHIGIAVTDLTASIDLYTKILNKSVDKTEIVTSQSVEVAFFQTASSKIELLSATHPESPIQKHLDKRGAGIHHVAFEVADLNKEIERLKSEGFTPLSDEPKKGANNKWVIFFHPKDTQGVLIELCQHIG
ncbi:MAG: methylmalonyl-CoA epimerase [Chitinophagales bacterium]|jgi:methylmalonyl-CoA/ethylmalonyl-CoA epimerase|nr:methylmalonyl-CoA epimerase [Chitinophagales bacterium]